MKKEKPFVIEATIEREFYSLDYFFDAYPQAEIHKIDGKDYIGQCVGCGAVILEGDQSFDWTDEVACSECEQKRIADQI